MRDMGCGPPRIEELPLGVSALESTADAVLVIGDRAMRVPHEPFHDVVDLGEAWHAIDRLAVCLRPLGGAGRASIWAICRRPWSRAARWAWRRRPTLARMHGPRLGLDFATCYDYLTRVLVLRPRGARDRRA